MYRNKNILAVVPARGGSKGVPLKNVHILAGKPLIYWTLELLQELDELVKTFVSTDSKKIKEIVEKIGFKPEVMRPDNISGDYAKDFEVIEHALNEMEKIDNKKYDIILMLQPTSPLRKRKQIIEILPTRQSLYNTYYVNGLAYAFSRDCIIKQKSRIGKKTAPFIIKEKVINIDTLEDFKEAEEYIKS